jgi:RHS repeat-associated protein
MPSLKFSNTNYRYGFNGKEKDDEGLGGSGATYDYGFRIYNPNIAKFLSVDPLTKSYPWYTPYQFAGNKPIKFIDLDGAEELEQGTFKEFTLVVPEIQVAKLKQVLTQRLNNFHGNNNYIPIPETKLDEKISANALYSDGVIYVSPSGQFKNFEDQVSILFHEYTHYLNECNGLYESKTDENGAIIQFKTDETYLQTPSLQEIDDNMKEWEESVLPMLIGPNTTKAETDQLKEMQRNIMSQPVEVPFRYAPSNLALDEISSYKAQLDGEKNGLFKLTDEARTEFTKRISTYTEIYNKRKDYEEKHNLNSDGSEKETSN